MFSGEQSHQLDEKNRIRIPARYKEDLKGQYVFCRGTTQCIYVMTLENFENMAKDFDKFSLFDAEAQEAISEFMSSFFPAEEDKHGRVVIPQALREYAQIDKNVVTVGVVNRLEIWSEELRNEKRKAKTFADHMKILESRTR